MKRVIKFRGKFIETGEWVYGFYWSAISFLELRHYILIDHNESFQVDPDSVGQFVGYCDKNGVEIYEDDILECNKHRFTVTFKEGEFTYIDHDFWFDEWYWADDSKRCRVVGNIHEPAYGIVKELNHAPFIAKNQVISKKSEFTAGIEIFLGGDNVNVSKELKKQFHHALTKACCERNIYEWSATITPFKEHYRFKRTQPVRS